MTLRTPHKQHTLVRSLAIALASLTAVVMLFEMVPAAIAAPTQPTQIAAARRRLRFRTGIRPSRRRIGGYSRSAENCNKKQLTAIIPPPSSDEQRKGTNPNAAMQNKTLSERPMFFAHLPNLPETEAEFILIGPNKRQVYTTTFKVPAGPGIVGIKLPSNAPALEVDKQYIWQFAVKCDPEKSARDLAVMGLLVRHQGINSSQPSLDQLAEQGVWHDILEVLARKRYTNPTSAEANADWVGVMEDANLAPFKTAKILQIKEQ
jgi:hypothetical protein